jgi:hypothetical protein
MPTYLRKLHLKNDFTEYIIKLSPVFFKWSHAYELETKTDSIFWHLWKPLAFSGSETKLCEGGCRMEDEA